MATDALTAATDADLQRLILYKLRCRDLMAAGATCTAWREFANEPAAWQALAAGVWGTCAASKSEFLQTANAESAKWNRHWQHASYASMPHNILSYSFKCSTIGDVSCHANKAHHNIHKIAAGTIVHGRIRLTFTDGESREGNMALVPQPSIPIGMGRSITPAPRQTIKWDTDDAGSTRATGTWIERMDPYYFHGFLCRAFEPLQVDEQQVEDGVGHAENVD